MKLFRDKGMTVSWSTNSKTPRIFWSNPLENQNFKCS